MYKILIVDDESLIRQGIIAQLDFLGYEFEEIFEADTGKSALQITEISKPDIVITDISMPEMDGLSFVETAKSVKKNVKFILLSGYAEFSYAQKAISLGISEYLLKPVSSSKLKESIDKVIAELNNEKRIKETSIHKNILSREKAEFLFEKDFNLLVNSIEIGNYNFLEKNYPSLVGRNTDTNPYFVLGIISINQSSYESGSFTQNENGLLRFSIKNVFNELNTKSDKLIVNNLTNEGELFILLYSYDEKRLRKDAEKIFLGMQAVFEKNMDIILSFGISKPSKIINEKCKKQAEKALNQRILFGKANIYFYEDMKTVPIESFPISELNNLETYIKRKETDKAKNTVLGIFSKEALQKYGINYLRVMWVRVLNLLLRNSSDYDENDIEVVLSGFSQTGKFENIEEMRIELLSIIEISVKKGVDKERTVDEKISSAIEFMKNNFNKDISINDIAEMYNLNINYFSVQFKKKTSRSAINFLTELRMKAAKEYLKNTEENVADISKKVGYEDTQYFFRVFKKSEGITPLMYRKRERKDG